MLALAKRCATGRQEGKVYIRNTLDGGSALRWIDVCLCNGSCWLFGQERLTLQEHLASPALQSGMAHNFDCEPSGEMACTNFPSSSSGEAGRGLSVSRAK